MTVTEHKHSPVIKNGELVCSECGWKPALKDSVAKSLGVKKPSPQKKVPLWLQKRREAFKKIDEQHEKLDHTFKVVPSLILKYKGITKPLFEAPEEWPCWGCNPELKPWKGFYTELTRKLGKGNKESIDFDSVLNPFATNKSNNPSPESPSEAREDAPLSLPEGRFFSL